MHSIEQFQWKLSEQDFIPRIQIRAGEGISEPQAVSEPFLHPNF